ncbi:MULTISPECIES: DivIVA domain-containing protein [unclassified Romboutsia]|uniref:DivIVA domain-containing protein n=1 Tax=unclassified Romboutsia TaxID=2626894 RepID=UPI0008214736|nr:MULTISPECIES: DivIVA domain-containing protein [unclassified Romboutsia]SCH14563.1 Minicell-associated protein DivIVA [uncultured Clostridium sp.]
MLTPIDIENKDFKKALRGYNPDDVDEFLDIVKEDFETLYRENIDLKEKLNLYQEQVSRYKSIEETLNKTLITAESTAADTCAAANKKAKIIVEQAELDARAIIEKGNSRVIEIRQEYDSLVKEFKLFRNKFKSLLEDEIRSVDGIFSDIDEKCKEPFMNTTTYDGELLHNEKEVATTID